MRGARREIYAKSGKRGRARGGEQGQGGAFIKKILIKIKDKNLGEGVAGGFSG